MYRCSCGEAGCGVIAPIITRSPHSPRVEWTDFRNYAGVFFHPLPAVGEDTEADNIGRPWSLPDLSFDLGLYDEEVDRASQDRSWKPRAGRPHGFSNNDCVGWISPFPPACPFSV